MRNRIGHDIATTIRETAADLCGVGPLGLLIISGEALDVARVAANMA